MRRALAKEKSIAQLCREYGISRKTGHKWINRYREQGSVGLVDGRRRPRGAPLATSAEMILEIIRLRQAHPSWGRSTNISRDGCFVAFASKWGGSGSHDVFVLHLAR